MANTPKQKYYLFVKFSLSVIGACEVAKKPHIFINIANQQIQGINRHFDENLNYFGTMVFVAYQEQNKSYTLKDILLQPDK